MFTPTEISLLQIPIRVVVIYLAVFLLLRLTGKKELGQLSPMDLLTMLLLSETVSPSLRGKVNGNILRRERISELELGMAIRREGVESLDDVEKAILEPTGFISVIKKVRD